MKVLFLKLVPNVWHAWEIKEISNAYATNFLIPKWLVKKISPQDEEKLKVEEKKEEKQKRELIINRYKIIEKLNWKIFIFKVKTWNNWKMFWSIWEKEIIQKINNDLKIKLEKKHIYFWPDGHIKKLWKRDLYIKLSSDSMAKITVITE